MLEEQLAGRRHRVHRVRRIGRMDGEPVALLTGSVKGAAAASALAFVILFLPAYLLMRFLAHRLGRQARASALGPLDRLLGGGFGRKSKCDYALEAALLSQKLGVPIRVQWTREDDLKHGFYHTVSAERIEAGIDKNGKVTA